MPSRRLFLQQSALAAASVVTRPLWALAPPNDYPPAVRITDGQHPCWFGYYDKWQTDPTGRYALGCRVGFEGRPPTEADELTLGLIDLQDGHRWSQIGTSRAWGWQQGCMLQWASAHQVVWNDREGDRFVARLLNVRTGQVRTLPQAIYALAPNGRFAVGTEFSRIQNLRPGYGYAGVPDLHAGEKAPAEIGLYHMDLRTGRSKLLVSLAQLATLPHQGRSVADNWHWFNHLLVSPDSRRVMFLHRWRAAITTRQEMAVGGFQTRMVTIGAKGQQLYVLDPSGHSSHFVWRDPRHLFVWTKPVGREWGFWLLEDQTQHATLVGGGTMRQNGHNTYVPHTNNEWVLNDTYPDAERNHTLYLYHIPSGRQVVLGKFHTPPAYTGEWRCDLHPRCNQQGTAVFIDSTHEGLGRQMYRIDISKMIGRG
jgi:hypothetical protein